MWNHISNGVVHEQFDTDPGFHPDVQVVDDAGQPGVAVGWTYVDGVFAAPLTVAATKLQLFAYADGYVAGLLPKGRLYPITGLTTPLVAVGAMQPTVPGSIYDDSGNVTADALQSLQAKISTMTWPHQWSDENYDVWSLSKNQLQQFIDAVFAYVASVHAYRNGTVIPYIHNGTISTYEQIDNLDWPV